MDEKSMGFYSIEYINRLIIRDPNITNLEGLPNALPKIVHLRITGRRLNSDISVPMNFRSFKGLPDKLPMLEEIEIYDCNIMNLETLTAKMPLLNQIIFYSCHIHNFKGIPKIGIGFINSTIDSFEGFEEENINSHSESRIFLTKTFFSSLHGISHIRPQSILINYFSRFGYLYAIANLTPKGIELLNDCVNPEVNNAYNPLEFVRRNLHRVYPEEYFQRISLDDDIKRNGVDYFVNILNENGIEYSGYQIWDDAKSQEGMVDWVYALSLEESLFIPEKIDCLLEFYKKSPTELALQYRTNPKSLPKDQIERLIHEADPDTLKILEDDEHSNLSSNDPVVDKISRKFAVRTKNGKILL